MKKPITVFGLLKGDGNLNPSNVSFQRGWEGIKDHKFLNVIIILFFVFMILSVTWIPF
jgi:hypothetical protein